MTYVAIEVWAPSSWGPIAGVSLALLWLWYFLTRQFIVAPLTRWREARPMLFVLGCLGLFALLGAISGVALLRYWLPPAPKPEVRQISVPSTRAPYIRTAVQELVFALKATAGRADVKSCEQGWSETRLPLGSLINPQMTIGSTLSDVVRAFDGVEKSGLFDPPTGPSRRIANGHLPVVEAYDALQVRQWVLTRERPVVGSVTAPERYAYGLIAIVDEAVLDDLKRSLDKSAGESSNTTAILQLPVLPDWLPLHNRLVKAGIPFDGIGGPANPNDPPPDPSRQYDYFLLKNGTYARLTLRGRLLTASERDTVARAIRNEERDEWWLNLVRRSQ